MSEAGVLLNISLLQRCARGYLSAGTLAVTLLHLEWRFTMEIESFHVLQAGKATNLFRV